MQSEMRLIHVKSNACQFVALMDLTCHRTAPHHSDLTGNNNDVQEKCSPPCLTLSFTWHSCQVLDDDVNIRLCAL